MSQKAFKYKVKPNKDKPQVMVDPILKFFNGGQPKSTPMPGFTQMFLNKRLPETRPVNINLPAAEKEQLGFYGGPQVDVWDGRPYFGATVGYKTPKADLNLNVMYGTPMLGAKINFFNGGFLMPAEEGGSINFPSQLGYRPKRMQAGGDISIPDLRTSNWVTKYANGGEEPKPKMQRAGEPERLIQRDYYLTPASGTRQPIYTSDPQDIRLTRHNDSIVLYNNYIRTKAAFDAALNSPSSPKVQVNITPAKDLFRNRDRFEMPDGSSTVSLLSPEEAVTAPQYETRFEGRKVSRPQVGTVNFPGYQNYFSTSIDPINIIEYNRGKDYFVESKNYKGDISSIRKATPDDLNHIKNPKQRAAYLKQYPYLLKTSNPNRYASIQEYAKPVQPVIYKKPNQIEFKDLPQPKGGYKSAAPTPQMISETPTKFSYTYPSGNEQKTIYFSDKGSWKAFTDQFDGLNTTEQAGSFSATPGMYTRERRPNPVFENIKYADGGVIKDNMGYWNPENWGKVVEIDSNNITMQGVDRPLLGVGADGQEILMQPGRDYTFNEGPVTEYPLPKAQKAIDVNKEFLTNWYSKRKITDPYIQGAFDLDRPAYMRNLQNMPDYTMVDSIDNDPNITGRYEADRNRLLLTRNAPEHVKTHELNHYLNTRGAGEYMRSIHKDIIGNELLPQSQTQGVYRDKYGYFSNPDEVHSRIMVLRQKAGFKPDEVVTPEKLKGFIKTYKGDIDNINDLLEMSNGEQGLLNMLNFMAKNQSSRLPMANYGKSVTNSSWLSKYQGGGEKIKVRDTKTGQVKTYDTKSPEYKSLYEQGIGAWKTFDNTTGKWVASDASNPNAEFVSSEKTLQPVVVSSKVKKNSLGDFAGQFLKSNPYDDFYQRRYNEERAKFQSAPTWAQHSVGGWDRDSRQQNIKDQIDKEYQQNYIDYISKGLQNRTPQGGLRRDKWLSKDNFTEKELGYLTGSTTLPAPNLWAQGLQGVYNLADMVTVGALPEINMPGVARAEVSQYNNPLLALAPLSIPAKMVQSTYKDNYSFGDALMGRANDAGLGEDIATDPLTYLSFGTKGLYTGLAKGLVNKIGNVTKIPFKLGNTASKSRLANLVEVVDKETGVSRFIKPDEIANQQWVRQFDDGVQRFETFGSQSPKNIDDLRRAYHNSERYLMPDEIRRLQAEGFGNSSDYMRPHTYWTGITQSQYDDAINIATRNRQAAESMHYALAQPQIQRIRDRFDLDSIMSDWEQSHNLSFGDNITQQFPDLQLRLQANVGDRYGINMRELFQASDEAEYLKSKGITNPDQQSQIYRDIARESTENLTTSEYELLRENFAARRTGRGSGHPITPDPTPRNASNLTKDQALSLASSKNKDVIANMSETEFKNSVVKPTGDVAPYQSGINLPIKQEELVPMPKEEYVQYFNNNIDELNRIIASKNKSGVEYRAVELTPNGKLVFETPAQTLPDGTVIPPGRVEWTVGIQPGEFRGKIHDYVNDYYYQSIPGLEMTNTGKSVFADKMPRRGSGAYESINDFLKKFDLGRLKPGFNLQTTESRGFWENAVKSGKASGYYGKYGVVHGIMYKPGGSIGEVGIYGKRNYAADTPNFYKSGGTTKSWLSKYQNGGEPETVLKDRKVGEEITPLRKLDLRTTFPSDYRKKIKVEDPNCSDPKGVGCSYQATREAMKITGLPIESYAPADAGYRDAVSERYGLQNIFDQTGAQRRAAKSDDPDWRYPTKNDYAGWRAGDIVVLDEGNFESDRRFPYKPPPGFTKADMTRSSHNGVIVGFTPEGFPVIRHGWATGKRGRGEQVTEVLQPNNLLDGTWAIKSVWRPKEVTPEGVVGSVKPIIDKGVEQAKRKQETTSPTTFYLKPTYEEKLQSNLPVAAAFSGASTRLDNKRNLINLFNDQELDKQLQFKLGITAKDLQNLKPVVFGIAGQETTFGVAGHPLAGEKELIADTISSDPSKGTFQIRYGSLTENEKKVLGINSPEDLLDDRKAYQAAIALMYNAKKRVDQEVEQGTHPGLVDKDPYFRAAYYYNSPARAISTAKQWGKGSNPVVKYDPRTWLNQLVTRERPHIFGSINPNYAEQAELRMDKGSYPYKLMERAKDLGMDLDLEAEATLEPAVIRSAPKGKVVRTFNK